MESQFTSKLIRVLRRAMPSAWICKHSNSYTAGVPDFSITFKDATTWWEVKTTAPLTKLQAATLERIGKTAFILRWGSVMWLLFDNFGNTICTGEGFDSLVVRIMMLCEENSGIHFKVNP